MGEAVQGKRLEPEKMLARGFLGLILLGSILLSLPFATADGKGAELLDSLFTAASAVCVTGLTIRDTAHYWSRTGHTIILCLIQLGGLGFMVFATLIMAALGRRITLRGRMLLKEALNEHSLSGLVRLTLVYGALALSIELVGAAALSIRFIPLLGLGEGLYYSFFHAVSAFCNAGFDLLGPTAGFSRFSGDPMVLLPVSGLILLGGLGFSVLLECLRHGFRFREFSLHAKVVLLSTGILLLFGWFFFTLAEWENPGTLGGLSPWERVLNGFFQSVSLRTAGFAAIRQQQLRDASKLIGVLLMFVGASPASTGGGVKTTTVSVLLLLACNVIRGREETNLLGRRLQRDVARRALTIVLISLFALLGAVTALSLLETGDFLNLMYECASALATVGLSSIGTAQLSPAGQGLLIPMMYLGRVGPLTLAMALMRRRGREEPLKYPEEKLMIG